jgi:integrase
MPKLTKRVVDAIAPPASGEAYAWDSELRGFGVRVMPSGVGAYLIKYRNEDRRTRKVVLGRVGTLTPDEARDLARQKLAAVARGEDPAEERQAARRAMTVRDLCDVYLAAAEKGQILGKRGSAKKGSTLVTDRSRIGRHIIPLLGNRKVADLDGPEIARFARDVLAGKTALIEKSDKPRGKSVVRGGRGAASRTLGLLGGILSFAVSEGIIPSNPAQGVKRPADQKRTARLTPELYAQLGRALAKMEAEGESAVATTAIRLLTLTGCRKGEVEKLRWPEVDMAGQALRLQDSKEGASVRPLGLAALGLAALGVLERASRRNGCEYVCPGGSGDENRPYGGLPGAWKRVANEAGLTGITLHTLRHSFASTAGDMGFSEPTIAALIGHAAGSVTGRYVHHLDAVLIAAADAVAQRIADQMMTVSSGKPDRHLVLHTREPAE